MAFMDAFENELKRKGQQAKKDTVVAETPAVPRKAVPEGNAEAPAQHGPAQQNPVVSPKEDLPLPPVDKEKNNDTMKSLEDLLQQVLTNTKDLNSKMDNVKQDFRKLQEKQEKQEERLRINDERIARYEKMRNMIRRGEKPVIPSAEEGPGDDDSDDGTEIPSDFETSRLRGDYEEGPPDEDDGVDDGTDDGTDDGMDDGVDDGSEAPDENDFVPADAEPDMDGSEEYEEVPHGDAVGQDNETEEEEDNDGTAQIAESPVAETVGGPAVMKAENPLPDVPENRVADAQNAMKLADDIMLERIKAVSTAVKSTVVIVEKMNDELNVSLAQVRKENQNLTDIALRMEKVLNDFVDIQNGTVEINDKVSRTVTYAKDVFQKEYAETLSSTATTACSQFLNDCRKHYEELFDKAVKNFKQFSDAAIAWQKDVESKSNLKLERVSKVSLVSPILLVIVLAMQAYIVFFK